MKKSSRPLAQKRDAMRTEYDFSAAVRGVTAMRYAKGSNIVVVEPGLRDVFPDSATVNEALRALAPLLRDGSKHRSFQKSGRRRAG